MKSFVKTTAVTAGATALALVSAAAYADWTIEGRSSEVTLQSTTTPTPFEPTASLSSPGTAVIKWDVRYIEPKVLVQRYIVTRHDGSGGTTQICDDSLTINYCVDVAVPPGTWTYTVRAAQGGWVSPHSPPSLPVTVAGPPTAKKALVAPSPTVTVDPSGAPSKALEVDEATPDPGTVDQPTPSPETPRTPEPTTDPVPPPPDGDPTIPADARQRVESLTLDPTPTPTDEPT